MAWLTAPSSIDDVIQPQTGKISLGCQVETKFQNEFVKDGKLTLVMNKDHASFQTTAYLENLINTQRDFVRASSDQGIAQAIDQVKIEVTIPASYADNPALFASLLLDTRTYPPQTDTKVIINERKQAIIVGVDVEIGPVAVMHKNRLIQTGDQIVQRIRCRRSGARHLQAQAHGSGRCPQRPEGARGRRDRHHQDAQAQAGLVRRADH